MQIIDSPTAMSALAPGLSLALIPTMGNLHAGHLSLIEAVKPHADKTVVSIFVNPTQFGPNEDFSAYPRTLEQDCELLASRGVDYVFAPKAQDIYPSDLATQTFIKVPGISDILCGASRPGHFQGVATIVCKLFQIVQPRVAIFGEKDFQQLQVIRRMVADLSLPVQVLSAPIVREASGLAMSSRNQYLSESERKTAPLLHQELTALVQRAQTQTDHVNIIKECSDNLNKAGFKTDYIALRRQDNLQAPGPEDKKLVVLAAAFLGKTRLIDNITFEVL
jgi:pantoate--beta-alanine ligase